MKNPVEENYHILDKQIVVMEILQWNYLLSFYLKKRFNVVNFYTVNAYMIMPGVISCLLVLFLLTYDSLKNYDWSSEGQFMIGCETSEFLINCYTKIVLIKELSSFSIQVKNEIKF
jgi:hypothetical protein